MTNLQQDYNNLTWQERRDLRNRYVQVQKGLCQHCKQPLSGPPSKEVQEKWLNLRLFPQNFLKYPIHLHHSHETGLTIGAVHAKCNGVLWQYYGE